MSGVMLHPGLWSVSRLFCYPDARQALAPLPVEVGAETRTLIEEMKNIDPVRLENEYVRLFINAMPEVSCAPYGSVYLEGTVMGESTVKVAAIYRRYGMAPEELADHIAVESEFLAWLHGRIDDAPQARDDFTYLHGHLRKWTALFFARVSQHDRLGCYRQGAELARRLLADLA
ncbi:MAG: molecular chaperone TorD family protein [Deltaproteobacteria bacterium]|nr:molecular chaperone TorD family protein [Deltaproteobacteria bacterium]